MRSVKSDNHPRPSTDNHLSVDATIEQNEHTYPPRAMREGFAASSGIRPETAETGGRRPYPEMEDESHPDRVPPSIEKENAGLAES